MYIKKMLVMFNSATAIATITPQVIKVTNIGLGLQHSTQHDIYNLATQYELLNQKPGLLKYSQMKTSLGSVTSDQLGIEIENTLDINVALKIISNDPINKAVDVIYIIYKKGFKDASGIITIYAKDANPNDDYDTIKSIVRQFQRIQTTIHGDLYPNQWKIGDTLDAEQLGITEPEKNAAEIVYTIKSIDLKMGEILVNALIKKGIEKTNLIIKVNGYKTQDTQNEEDLNRVLEEIDDESETTNPIFPEWEIGDKVTAKELGIKEIDTPEQINIEYEIKQINEQTGEITVQVKVTNEKDEFKKIINITGFETKDQKDRNTLDKVMEQITDETSSLIDEFPNWQVGDEVTREQLGILPLEIEADDVKVTYKVKELVPKTGTIIVEVTGTVGDKTETKTININGFKSDDEKNHEIINQVREIVNQKYNNITLDPESPLTKKLPREVKETFTGNLTNEQLEDFKIEKLTEEEKQTTTINYKIVDFNDDTGQITVEVVISKDDVSTQSSFTISGFETKEKHNKRILDEIYQDILNQNNLTEDNKIVKLIPDSIFNSRLPSKVKISNETKLTTNQLKNLNVKLPKNPEADIVVTAQNINDENGTLEVKVVIKVDNNEKTLVIIVDGFRKKIEQDNLEVHNLKSFLQDKYKDVRIPQNSDDKKLLPSEIHAELGGDNLTSDNLKRFGVEVLNKKVLKDATVDYKIIETNDGSGQITIHVNITQGAANDNFTFQVKDFQTQNQRNQIEADQALANFKEKNDNHQLDESNDFANQTVSDAGFKVGDILTPERLESLEIIIDNDDLEIDWEFKVVAIDDATGKLTIEVIAIKGFAEAKDTINIIGFLESDLKE